MELAQRLISTPIAQLHICAVKALYCFGPEIRACAESGNGVIGACAYAPFKYLQMNWRADTQEVEGVMNMIKTAVARSPAIGLALLDARVGNRKQLGYNAGVDQLHKRKFSLIQNSLDELLGACAELVPRVHEVMVPNRWEPPVPCVRNVPISAGHGLRLMGGSFANDSTIRVSADADDQGFRRLPDDFD
jgi:hypothetical protein